MGGQPAVMSIGARIGLTITAVGLMGFAYLLWKQDQAGDRRERAVTAVEALSASSRLEGTERAAAVAAMDILFENCSGVVDWWDRFREKTLRIDGYVAPGRSDPYGWRSEVGFSLTLPDGKLPFATPRGSGHTLFFYVGSGPRGKPGIVAVKPWAHEMCEMRPANDPLYKFKPAPRANVIDRLLSGASK